MERIVQSKRVNIVSWIQQPLSCLSNKRHAHLSFTQANASTAQSWRPTRNGNYKRESLAQL